MTKRQMMDSLESQRKTIDQQKGLLRACVAEIEGMHLSLKSARMFAAAVMSVKGIDTIQFKREHLDEIVRTKDVAFTEIKENDLVVGVELRIVDAKNEMELAEESRE